MNTRLDRREFIKAGAAAGAGLTLGFYLPAGFAQTGGPAKAIANAAAAPFAPNAFVRIGSDGTVTVIAKHIEMGQGAHTGLATLLAEELDADWSRVVVQGAPADAKLYNNLAWGAAQGTGGSSAIANSYEQMRKAGATARSMLVAAAAQEWNVPADAITVDHGVVAHGDRKASFGQLAQKAAGMPVPADVKLKDPKNFTLIGKDVPRKDSKAKTNGTRSLHHRREAARHADGRGRASAAVRREGEVVRRCQGEGDQGRGRGRASPARRCGAREGFLDGEARARRAVRAMGRQRRHQVGQRRDPRAVQGARRQAGARGAQGR